MKASDSIFLIHADQQLVEAIATPYALEKDLQDLLEDHVQLIPGVQIDRADPPRWLVVKREAGVPLEESGGGWFAVDLVMVDHNAIPTFVEIKRSTDTRNRRTVVAQMLDYVANGTVYWKPGTFRLWYDERAHGPEPAAEKVGDFLGRQDEVAQAVADDFWTQVDANLRQGRVRCIFVADEIPPTLQRLVEFLNEQLRQVEVLAVEVRQYQADGVRALVPRLIGATAAAMESKKQSTAGAQKKVAWQPDEVLEDIRSRAPDVAWIPERVIGWASTKEGITLPGGHGPAYPSFAIAFDTERKKGPRIRKVLAVSGGPGDYAMLEVHLHRILTTGPFHKGERHKELRKRIEALGIARLEHALLANEKRPSVAMSLISNGQLDGLLTLLAYWCDEARRYNATLETTVPGDHPDT